MINAFVVSPKLEAQIIGEVSESTKTPNNNVFGPFSCGIRILTLVEMEQFDHVLAFRSILHAVKFVNKVDLARDNGEDTMILIKNKFAEAQQKENK